MPSRCCAECFDDRGLRKIIQTLDRDHGKCDYCGTENVDLIDPSQLSVWFELLVSIYEADANGKPLVDWFMSDWELFSHPRLDGAHAKELLSEILDDGEIVRQTFYPSPTYQSEGLARWETLRDELLYKNRYFLDQSLDEDRLAALLSYLIADNLPETWYRARIITDGIAYPIDQMSSPPKHLASHGRANPAGIPYLYLGSSPDTAITEIRPHTGEAACVADFRVETPLKAVDLRNPRKLVSPFTLVDESAIGRLRADIPFLERLGKELTRPVLPRSAAIDYIPSQYLCEFIKKNHYDGVVYSSSVSGGINLALFDPQKAAPGTVSRYNITRVTVDIEEVQADVHPLAYPGARGGPT